MVLIVILKTVVVVFLDAIIEMGRVHALVGRGITGMERDEIDDARDFVYGSSCFCWPVRIGEASGKGGSEEGGTCANRGRRLLSTQ